MDSFYRRLRWGRKGFAFRSLFEAHEHGQVRDSLSLSTWSGSPPLSLKGRSRWSESKGQRVIFERYYASLRIQEWFFLGIAGLEPATIRLKAQCSTNWAIHPKKDIVVNKDWCGKEKGAAPLLLIILKGRGSVWGSYCGASEENVRARVSTPAR